MRIQLPNEAFNMMLRRIRYRLDKMLREEKLLFMKQNGIVYEEVRRLSLLVLPAVLRPSRDSATGSQATMKEIEARQTQLKAVRDAQLIDRKQRSLPLPAYFKVPFTEAVDLVGTRKVYLEGGVAYVPFDHIVTLLYAAFRANVSTFCSDGKSRDFRELYVSNGICFTIFVALQAALVGVPQVQPLGHQQRRAARTRVDEPRQAPH
jgi:DNA primase large subunit